MNAAQRHWKRELNECLNRVDELEAKGKKVPAGLLHRVKFVAACMQAHNEN